MSTTYTLFGENKECEKDTLSAITHYPALKYGSRAAVVIFPGGAYAVRAAHEGEGYAQFLNAIGVHAFVVNYRVAPDAFPAPLLDARRAVRFVRANAERFGIDKDKIAVMGSSAGGHLAALVATYRGSLDGEGGDSLDGESPIPNAQILCYPVISGDEAIAHIGSYRNLLGNRYKDRMAFSPDVIADQDTPQAFIWHTANDAAVNVINSYRYATRLRLLSIPCEMHIFPNGPHGIGTAPNRPHVRQWLGLLENWLLYIGFTEDLSRS